MTFGVSGMLYRSNILMYDHQTESLWSQVKGTAVAGPMTDTPLQVLPSTLTTWKKWKRRYPDTEVLSIETGYQRDYNNDPYERYYREKRGLFSFLWSDPGEKDKELVAGIIIGAEAKAFPVDLLRKAGVINDRVGGKAIKIAFDPETDNLIVTDKDGNIIPYITGYWFVWEAIHPHSTLYKVEAAE